MSTLLTFRYRFRIQLFIDNNIELSHFVDPPFEYQARTFLFVCASACVRACVFPLRLGMCGRVCKCVCVRVYAVMRQPATNRDGNISRNERDKATSELNSSLQIFVRYSAGLN